MNFPKKIEINVENELQAGILYACFNKTAKDVLDHLGKSTSPLAKSTYLNYKNGNYFNGGSFPVGEFIQGCWEKADSLLKEIYKSQNNRLAKIKVRIDGKEFYEILSFENIKRRNELPSNYLSDYPVFFLPDNLMFESTIYIKETPILTHFLTIGKLYRKEFFDQMLHIMFIAGGRLAKLKKATVKEENISIAKVKSKNKVKEGYNIREFII